MRLAFYIAAKGRLFSKVIAFLTHGPYSHVELVFDEWDHRFYSNMDIREHDAGGSLCFSSAENDGGTRFKILDLKDGKWDCVRVDLDPQQAMRWCIAHQHLAYDWRGLRGFIFPWRQPDPKDLFCSECAVECGQNEGLFTGVWAGRTSPSALARIMRILK